MKNRNGFVSNSSSSSFIISVPKGASTKIKITMEVDLNDFVDEKITTLKDAMEYIKNEEFPFCDAGIAEKCLEELKKGNIILSGSFSNENDNPAEFYLCDNGIPKTYIGEITIIDNEGGF